jgi:hypothetical protein
MGMRQVVLLGTLIACFSIFNGTTIAQDGTWQSAKEYEHKLDDRSRSYCSPAKVESAAKSPEVAEEIVLHMEATVRAAKLMLIGALRKSPSPEARNTILHNLAKFELGDEDMSIVARDIGFLAPEITKLEEIAGKQPRQDVQKTLQWLARQKRRDFLVAYPACGALERQGPVAVSVMRSVLSSFPPRSDGFQNGAHLLSVLCSPGDNRRWADDSENKLSGAQKGVFLTLISEYEKAERKNGRRCGAMSDRATEIDLGADSQGKKQ